MSVKAVKILVTGDVKGNFDALFSKVSSLQKKNTFDMLFCVGEFFGDSDSEWDSYANGEKKVPITTYILGTCDEKHAHHFADDSGADLCENVTYLGKKGTFTSSSGLQVAYLSGLDGRDIGDSAHFCHSDVQSMKWSAATDPKFMGVDIMLTSVWPKMADKYAKPVVAQLKEASAAVAQLALALRPRYHFAGYEGEHYERHPYRNHRLLQDAARHVTRFIALASVPNTQKKKFLYGANIVPMCHMKPEELTAQPEDTTECPYRLDLDLLPDKTQGEDNGGVQYFYSAQPGRKRKPDDDSRPHAAPRKPPQPSGPCWFCLGSPEVEKHLVVAVGTQVYVALAKGGLVRDHLLILPIGHYQSYVTTPDDVLAEVNDFKNSLEKCFKSTNMSVVFFERNFKSAHLQIQVVPVATSLADNCQNAFSDTAGASGLELSELPANCDLKQILQPGVPYFYVELPSGKKFMHRISKTFPIQFGREAMASPKLLNMADRTDWKQCTSTKEEEMKAAADFRVRFKEFDVSLQKKK